ncbi:MAG: hypothetical protein P1P90_03990 [Patescibacteria group bacterium]|nr:hypothetical protein [Patescibacteria group bacterium]
MSEKLPYNPSKNPFSDELDHTWNKYTHEANHIATGGESEVYELIGRPDIVVKFDWGVTLQIANENAKQNLPMDALDDKRFKALKNKLREEEKAYNDFKKYFGSHALVQKRYFIKIPYHKLETWIIEGINNYKTTVEPSEYIWTIARIQRRVNFDKYERVFEGEFEDNGSVLGPDIADFINETEPGFQRMLKDFVERAVKYTIDTGHILDITGRKNIVFLKSVHGWDYKLIDVFFAGTPRLQRAREGDRSAIINANNYLHAILKLSKNLGIDDGLKDFIELFDY